MGLQYKVKAGSITNLTDARYFNALGADWIGFNLDVLSENSLALKDAKEIKNWLFEPKIVIEAASHQDKTELTYLANELYAEAVQVTLDHPIFQEDHFLYPIILEISFEDISSVKFKRARNKIEAVETIVIKVNREGFKWSTFKSRINSKVKAIERLKSNYTVLIDLPFQKDWFVEALAILNPHGVQISGSVEMKPGLSLVDVYDDLLEQINDED